VTAYPLSLGAGLGVGVAYGALGVRSPAPPVVALLGLLGMLAGEAMVSYLRGHRLPDVVATLCHVKSFAHGPVDGTGAMAASSQPPPAPPCPETSQRRTG
jgi:XapX domain-containing protein